MNDYEKKLKKLVDRLRMRGDQYRKMSRAKEGDDDDIKPTRPFEIRLISRVLAEVADCIEETLN